MGLLTQGTPMAWHDATHLIDYVKKHGIVQFLKIYAKLKDRHGDDLKWGDEVCWDLYVTVAIRWNTWLQSRMMKRSM